MFRIGIGQDSHKFDSKAKKPLILGGVEISNRMSLSANSDGDVILHSLFNALSSAVGKESIGKYADSMSKKQGITDSREYLKIALKLVKEAGYKVNNVSITVEAKKPKVSWEQQNEMKKVISKILEIEPDDVGITFTSGEKLTPFGKGEGIQVFTIASLRSFSAS